MSRFTIDCSSAAGCRTIRTCALSRAISATREKLAQALAGQDAVLHLACISNDASFELDEKLSRDHQLRLLRADGDRGEEGRRQAVRLLLVELGLWRAATRPM